jgi:hypothetical protein
MWNLVIRLRRREINIFALIPQLLLRTLDIALQRAEFIIQLINCCAHHLLELVNNSFSFRRR